MKLTKPFYFIRVKSQMAKYIIRLNGCEIHYQEQKAGVQFDHPVNHYLQNGTNQFSVALLHSRNKKRPNIKALERENKISLELLVKQHGTREEYSIATLDFNASLLPDLSGTKKYVDFNVTDDVLQKALVESTKPVGLALVDNQFVTSDSPEISVLGAKTQMGELNRTEATLDVDLYIPFEDPKFLQADDLPLEHTLSDEEYEAFTNEIREQVKPIWQHLNNNEVDKIAPLLEQSRQEYDACFYKNSGTSLKEIIGDLQSSVNSKEEIQVPLEKGNSMVFYNKKIAYWCTSAPQSKLAFRTDEGLFISYPMFFARINGKWEVVR